MSALVVSKQNWLNPFSERNGRRTLMDWMLVYFTYTFVYITPILSAGFLVDFNGKYHAHTALPFHVPIGFHLLLFVMEVISVGFGLSLWAYFVISQVIFFDHFYRERNRIKRRSNNIELNTSEMLAVELHQGLKQMLLTVIYFNHVFSMPIFICKLLALLDSTVDLKRCSWR